MSDMQNDIWKQLLSKATEFTLQVNDPVRWAKNFLNVDLEANQEDIIRNLCDPKCNYLGILGARGSGKSYGTCIGLIKLCEDYPGIDIGLFGPRADQATRLIGETKKILFASPLKEQVDWDRTTNDKIIFKNGSHLLALSAAETSLQEGWHFSVVVVDEAHRVSNASMSERIIPMLGSKKISKLIKIGIPLFKNHFYSSFSDDKYEFLVHDWTRAPILLKSGAIMLESVDGKIKSYPTFVLDRMPKSLKMAMFPKHLEIHSDGDMTEMEFNTQYGMIWMDDINTFLRGEEPEKLVGTHQPLMAARAGETYFFGLDTSSGTLTPGKYDLDFTALSIWRLRGDGVKERVWSREWQGGETLAQMEEIAGIIHPQSGLFPCSFGCVDYSNIGITAVEMFKRLKIPVAGVLFSATDPTSHKNFKNAMANQFQFELQADRVKYPQEEAIDRDKIMRKHYHQWLALERIVSVGLNDKITAPPGLHDDGCMSDLLAVWACDKNMTFSKTNSAFRIGVASANTSIVQKRPGGSNRYL